jgi:sortase A
MGISSVVGLDRSGRGARSRRIAARVLEGVLVAAGTTLLIVFAVAQVDAMRGRSEALEAFAQARSEQAAAATEETDLVAADELEYPVDPDQSLWGNGRIAAYRASLAGRGETPLGVLTISAVELVAPIFDGTDERTLNRGIGRIEGTADIGAAGNLGLAAHRDGFFRVLKDVKVGDAISVETLHGTTHYRITELLVVDPTDVYVLAPTDTATLTLVTCYPFYFIGEAPQRYIVKGVAKDTRA